MSASTIGPTSRLLAKPRLTAALAVLTALAAGLTIWLVFRTGSDAAAQPTDDPVAFLRGIVRGVAANDYERVWPTLHPAQQRIATRELYVRCERLTPVPGHLAGLQVVRAIDSRITVAGAGAKRVVSKAVTFRVKIADAASGQAVVVTQTAHAVAIDGHWRWILSAQRFASYQSGSCPSGVATPGSA